MKKVIKPLTNIVDFILIPFLVPSAILMRILKKIGIQRLKLSKKILFSIGVFPIRDHYYEPLFNDKYLNKPLDENRELPGINWNIDEQYELLNKFTFNDELSKIPLEKKNDLEFYFNNGSYESTDADFWYNLIRFKKPKRIFEIGSGNSTLMALKAIEKNKEEDNNYICKHVCIEPFEMPWLSKTNITLIRKKVEDIPTNFFSELEENDILFIDSSHIIRPQGDVLFEYLQILPSLNKGVIVHIHDIFSPRDYPKEWVVDLVRMWNEQYLLEAFLTCNNEWKIIGAVNYLRHNHYEKLKLKSPHLKDNFEPGSFYMQKKV